MIEKNSLAGRAKLGASVSLLVAAGLSIGVGLLIRSGKVPGVSDFSTVFLSILFEAFPFVLIGTIISSMIHLFVTPETLNRVIPKNKFAGLFIASIAGFAFPICECANVPVTRRLIAKGMPTPVAVTFLLAVAIVNPVVLLSTWIAFGGDWKALLLRGGLGMAIAITSGWLVGLVPEFRAPLRDRVPVKPQSSTEEHVHGDSCGCKHDQCAGGFRGKTSLLKKAQDVLEHTGSELYAVGRFLVMGAAVAATMQTILPRASLIGIGAAPLASILVLMFLTYILSLCSEADAFIAATFASYFTPGAVMAFMLYGPMMDIKNTLMLLEGFKPRFVAILFALTTLLCLVAGFAINSSGIWGGLL